jgi:hypothetical protein
MVVPPGQEGMLHKIDHPEQYFFVSTLAPEVGHSTPPSVGEFCVARWPARVCPCGLVTLEWEE